MNDLEKRFIEFEDVEAVEEKREGGLASLSIRGYAAMFNKLSLNLGGFREKIAAGAFAKSLKRDVVALWSHNIDIVLGRQSNNTLQLEEDSKGLRFNLDLPDTSAGRDAYQSIKRRDVKGMSFGFRIPPKGDTWEFDEQKNLIRTLNTVDLFEVSPTVFPAYPDTEVGARSEVRSLDEILKYGRSQLPPDQMEIAKALQTNNRNRLRLAEVG